MAKPKTTTLSPEQERLFQVWAALNNVRDVDKGYYDYRGWFKEQLTPGMRREGEHYPDTFKQHGHPTFSVESKYSLGHLDGGRWEGDVFVLPNGLRIDMADPDMADLWYRTTEENPAATIWPMPSHKSK